MTINPRLIIALASILASAYAGHWITRSHYVKKEQAALIASQAAAIKQTQRENDIVDGWAKAAEIIRQQQRTRTVYVDREIDRPVYRSCTPTDDGWLQLQDAIREANGKSSPHARLPAATGSETAP